MDKSKKFDLKKLLLDNGIIVLLMILVLYVSITVPTFRSFRNLMNLAINAAPRVIIALGISACLITKGTDLSAGRVVGLSACLAGIMLQKPDAPGKIWPNFPVLNVWVVLLIVIAICAVFGVINGVVISYLNVPAFIGTLGMQLIVYGIALVVTNSVPIGGYRADYIAVTQGKVGPIPLLFIYLIIAAAIFWFVYNICMQSVETRLQQRFLVLMLRKQKLSFTSQQQLCTQSLVSFSVVNPVEQVLTWVWVTSWKLLQPVQSVVYL